MKPPGHTPRAGRIQCFPIHWIGVTDCLKCLKRLFALLLAVTLAMVCALSGYAVADSAQSVCVIDVDSGRVLYSRNEHEKLPIASTTKIMTGLLCCELATEEDLETVITVSKHATDEKGSSLYMLPGDKITLRTALYGTMLRSGNDAAMVIAEYLGGDEETFLEMMNDTAKMLGMNDTHYSCPNGLTDEDNYSSAYDLALLGTVAMENKLFAEVVKTWVITTPEGYTIDNHNKLLNEDSRCIGIKTGWTPIAGRCLVSCFQDPDSGRRVVTCTLNAPDMYNDHVQAADWAFKHFKNRTLCAAGKTAATVTLWGTDTLVPLVAEDTIRYPLTDEETNQVTCSLDLPANAAAMADNDVVGQAVYYFKGEEIGRTNLLASFSTED